MKLENPIELVKRRPQLLWYCMAVEAVYVLYEFALMRGTHDGSRLALGLVLTVLTLPSALIAGWVQWHVAELFGYIPGETQAFWPRFVAWQVPIFLNWLLLIFWTTRRTRARRRNVEGGDA